MVRIRNPGQAHLIILLQFKSKSRKDKEAEAASRHVPSGKHASPLAYALFKLVAPGHYAFNPARTSGHQVACHE